MFSLFAIAASTGAADISMSIHSYLFEASSVICKNPSHSDNASILFILLELILVLLCCLNYMLQLKDLRVGQWKEPCIGLTQENLIESSVQDGLPYIPLPNGLCKLFLTYPK